MAGKNSAAIWKVTQRDLDDSAKLWHAIHAKVGDALTSDMQDALAKSTQASRSAEDVIHSQSLPGSSQPLITHPTMLRRAYVPMARVKAAAGDTDAQRFLDLDSEATELERRLQHATPTQALVIQRQLDRVRVQAAAAQAQKLAGVNQRIDRLERVKANQLEVTPTERINAERLQTAAATSASGHEAPLVPDAYQAELPTSSAVERAQMRGRVEARTQTRALRPVDAELNRLKRQRAQLEGGTQLSSDVHKAVTRRLEQRLDQTDTPQRLEDALAQSDREGAEMLAKLRNTYRAERNPEAAPVAPGQALDTLDPAYFPHAVEGSRGVGRIFRGQSGGALNLNPSVRYGARLGFGGKPSTGDLFGHGAASSDPATFFGAVAKPSKIAGALQHLQDQVSAFSVKAEPGTQYDPHKWVLLNLSRSGKESILTGGARTAESIDQALRDAQSGDDLQHQVLGKFTTSNRPRGQKATVAFESVPHDQAEYVLVSKHGLKQLKGDFLSGGVYDNPVFRGLTRGTKAWRWATLLARPAWLVGNIVGNSIQAGLAGAGPIAFARAIRTGEGGKYEGTLPVGTEGGGLFRNLFTPSSTMKSVTHPIRLLTDAFAEGNVRYENLTRRAVALRHAVPAARFAAGHGDGKNLLARFHRVNADVLDEMRKAKDDPLAAGRIVDIVNKWLGDYAQVRHTPLLDLVSPFWRWYAFVGKLTVSMPFTTPGRALLLQRLGAFGVNVNNSEFGGYTPNSLVGAFKLPAQLPYVGGLWKGTQSLNPFATAFQLLDPNDQSTTNPLHPGPAGVLGAFNPLAGIGYNTATGRDFANGRDLVDSAGNPAAAMNPRVFLNQLEGAIPAAGTIGGTSGVADTSTNPFRPQLVPQKIGGQAPTPLAGRLAAYLMGSTRPYDPLVNQVASTKRLVSAERAAAINNAKRAAR